MYMKQAYKYTDAELQLLKIAKTFKGSEIGGGTNLTTGKRDKQYFFLEQNDAKKFLKQAYVKKVTLKEHELSDLQND